MRQRWGVENRNFWVRDVLLREDHAQARGALAFNLCALRAFVLNCLNYRKVQAKKAALEAFSFNPLSALRFLGLHTKDV